MYIYSYILGVILQLYELTYSCKSSLFLERLVLNMFFGSQFH